MLETPITLGNALVLVVVSLFIFCIGIAIGYWLKGKE